jgi:hypothetical protein
MFSIKDLESLWKLAQALVVPFFSIACLMDKKIMETYFSKDYNWFLEHSSPISQNIGWVLLFVTVVFSVSVFCYAIDLLIVWLHICCDGPVLYLVALLCLTFGLLPLSVLFLKDAPSLSLNVFWHLGFFSYGVICLENNKLLAS